MPHHLSPTSRAPFVVTRLVLFASLLSACDSVIPNVAEPVVEAPMIVFETVAEPNAIAPEPTYVEAPRASRSTPQPREGVLTAGDIDDALNLAAFTRQQKRAAKALRLPRADLSKPVLAQLVNPDGAPAPRVRITLRKPGAAEPFYDGYSGVDGAVTVFPSALGFGRMDTVELRAFPTGSQRTITAQLTSNGKRPKIIVPAMPVSPPDFLDLVFAIDTTGSMDDELEWLVKDLNSVLRAAKRGSPDVDIRLGLVVYKSRGDRYVVKEYGFTKNQREFKRWLNEQLPTSGGGGAPEAVADALETAVAMDWRRGRGERLLFQIGDEPPHVNQTKTYLDAAKDAARKGVQLYGIGASGVEAHLEYLMRQGAILTNGRYVFLTDDSDVGNGHGEPSISCYRVTELNALMVRLLRSELEGRRIEASEQQVVRDVGSYDKGVCRS